MLSCNNIDDVCCFSNSWEDHLKSLDKILTILQDNDFTVNPLKCEWGVKETDWLCYWLTPTGLKPWRKKINAILAINKPKTNKQLRSFLGAINFYRDMWRGRSGIVAPLTSVSAGNGIVVWNDEMNKAFATIKALMAKDAFLRYPDHYKPFHIYTDASDYQMGAAIMQDNVPVPYWSKKLNAAQKNYTVGEKELLSIVEVLKEFKTMLYGCPQLHVYTDHLNNVFTSDMTNQSQCVIRWGLFLEEFGVKLHRIRSLSHQVVDLKVHFDQKMYSEANEAPTIMTCVNRGANYASDYLEFSSSDDTVKDDHRSDDCDDPHSIATAEFFYENPKDDDPDDGDPFDGSENALVQGASSTGRGGSDSQLKQYCLSTDRMKEDERRGVISGVPFGHLKTIYSMDARGVVLSSLLAKI